MIIMAKTINTGICCNRCLTAAAAGAVAALIAKKDPVKRILILKMTLMISIGWWKETAKEDQEPAEDFQSWEHALAGEQSATDDTESEEAEEAADKMIWEVSDKAAEVEIKDAEEEDADEPGLWRDYGRCIWIWRINVTVHSNVTKGMLLHDYTVVKQHSFLFWLYYYFSLIIAFGV